MGASYIFFDDYFDVRIYVEKKEIKSTKYNEFEKEYELYIGDDDGGIGICFRTKYAFKQFIDRFEQELKNHKLR